MNCESCNASNNVSTSFIRILTGFDSAWQVNTELAPLDLDDIKAAVEKDDQGKKTKSLWEAWKVAAEGHDLEHFKKMLSEHEKALQADREEKAEAEAKKEAKKDKTRRKSGIQDEDVEMEDADADASGDKKAKAGSKKRKKDDDSDGEAPKVIGIIRPLLLSHTDGTTRKPRRQPS